MKRILALFSFFVSAAVSAQNTGIGTSTPQAKLHVVDSLGDALATVESMIENGAAQIRAKTRGGSTDFLQLQKWAPGTSGFLSSIPLSNLSTVLTGNNAGPLAIGTQSGNNLYFLTNNATRMLIDNNGQISVNGASSLAYFNVRSETATTPIYASNENTTGTNSAITGLITGAAGSGITGIASNSGSTAGMESTSYGVVGLAGDNNIGVGGYALSGTGLRGKSLTGLALHTTGGVQLSGISEGAGKVLTSDANGNATWQTPATATSQWTTNGTNIHNSNTGNVGIGTNAPLQKLDVVGNVRADNFQLTAPKTMYYAVGSADFNSKIGADVERKEELSGGGIFMENSTQGLVAPVHLPHGAVVTRVSVVYTNNSPTVHLNINLRRSADVSSIASLSNLNNSNTFATTTTIFNGAIDNSNAAYVLEAYPTNGSWPNVSLVLRRVIIEYTISGY